MIVLGIETSCDETAAAVVENGDTLLSSVIASSADIHVKYGGVVPEIAARSHIESITPVIDEALKESGCSWDDIDAIAVTYGAGLGGSLLIGVLAARTLAITHNKPLYPVNHVEGHVYANFITGHKDSSYTKKSLGTSFSFPPAPPKFPMLALIVSGGHSQLVLFRSHFDYTLLGQTMDDAVGEAFDKVAKIIGLPYPGGVSISKLAPSGNSEAFSLPKADMKEVPPALEQLREDISSDQKHSYDFSFSGLKTAVLRLAQQQIGEDFRFPSKDIAGRLSPALQADIAASFQRIAIETVVDKAVLAYNEFQPASVVIAGGVAASGELRRQLSERIDIAIDYPDIKLCGDNGAMIAALGCFHVKCSRGAADPYTLDIAPNLSM